MAEPKHTLSRMDIEPAENGGHTVTHYFKAEPKIHRGGLRGGFDGGYIEPAKHVFGKGEDHKVMAHVAEHLGLKMEGAKKPVDAEEEEEE